MSRLDLCLQPSKWLMIVIIFYHGLVIYSGYLWLAMDWWLVWCLGFTAHAWWQVQRYRQSTIARMIWTADDRWLLIDQQQQLITDYLQCNSIVTAKLIILNFQSQSLILFPDSLSKADFKRLLAKFAIVYQIR